MGEGGVTGSRKPPSCSARELRCGPRSFRSLWSLLRPGASNRRPVSVPPNKPRTSPTDCAPQSQCSHGSYPRSSTSLCDSLLDPRGSRCCFTRSLTRTRPSAVATVVPMLALTLINHRGPHNDEYDSDGFPESVNRRVSRLTDSFGSV
jgi:hypothetical protein